MPRYILRVHSRVKISRDWSIYLPGAVFEECSPEALLAILDSEGECLTDEAEFVDGVGETDREIVRITS